VKILFLTNYYPPYHIGGYEELCAEVCLCLRARGHIVEVVTSRRGRGECLPGKGIYRDLFTEIDYQERLPGVSTLFSSSRRHKENLVNIAYSITDLWPQAILVWGMWNLSRRILEYLEEEYENIPLLYYVADYWPSLPSSILLHWKSPAKNRLKTAIKKWVCKSIVVNLPEVKNRPHLKFEHVVCVSKAVRDTLVEEGALPESADVVYNGIDLDAFHHSADRRSPRPCVKFIYTGRLAPEKGVHIIPEALGILKSIGLLPEVAIVGSGDIEYQARLKEMVDDLGINDQVHFLGRLNRDEIPRLLSDYDVQIVPSVWNEPMPRTIQEAMALGKAVIAANTGGIPEIVLDELTGLLFQPGDASELAQKMRKLINNPALIWDLGSAGRMLVEKQFTLQYMVENLERYLWNLCS
jgi:glycosyltransferase involved in cell wall biosynthesis